MQHCGEPLRVHAHGHGALARTIHPLEQAARCAQPRRGRVCAMPGCDAICAVYCVLCNAGPGSRDLSCTGAGAAPFPRQAALTSGTPALLARSRRSILRHCRPTTPPPPPPLPPTPPTPPSPPPACAPASTSAADRAQLPAAALRPRVRHAIAGCSTLFHPLLALKAPSPAAAACVLFSPLVPRTFTRLTRICTASASHPQPRPSIAAPKPPFSTAACCAPRTTLDVEPCTDSCVTRLTPGAERTRAALTSARAAVSAPAGCRKGTYYARHSHHE
jgi:hypothetical protein